MMELTAATLDVRTSSRRERRGQVVRLGLGRPRRPVAKADDVQGQGRDQLDVVGIFELPAEPRGVVETALDARPVAATAVGGESRPDRQRARAARELWGAKG